MWSVHQCFSLFSFSWWLFSIFAPWLIPQSMAYSAVLLYLPEYQHNLPSTEWDVRSPLVPFSHYLHSLLLHPAGFHHTLTLSNWLVSSLREGVEWNGKRVISLAVQGTWLSRGYLWCVRQDLANLWSALFILASVIFLFQPSEKNRLLFI